MKTTVDEHNRHKDVYEHTLMVVEQAIDLEKSHKPTSSPDFILRFAALMHDVGKPKTRRFEGANSVTFHHHEVVGAKMTRKRMKALRFSNDEIDQVSTLVELHLRFHGYGSGEWTDSAVRRYVRDAGDQLVRLHKLTRADCTTRNARKAAALARTYDSLEARIADLAAHEELASIRPDLDGEQIMEILGIGPGREVGQAYRFLLDLRLDRPELGNTNAPTEAAATKATLKTTSYKLKVRPRNSSGMARCKIESTLTFVTCALIPIKKTPISSGVFVCEVAIISCVMAANERAAIKIFMGDRYRESSGVITAPTKNPAPTMRTT